MRCKQLVISFVITHLTLVSLIKGEAKITFLNEIPELKYSRDISFRIGLSPINFSRSEPFLVVVNEPTASEGRLEPLLEKKDFAHLFMTPFMIAVQMDYALIPMVLFCELNYIHANGNLVFERTAVRNEGMSIALLMDSFDQVSAYLGHRVYFKGSSDKDLAGFLGYKLGLAWYKGIEAKVPKHNPDRPDDRFLRMPLYDSHVVISGGLQSGFKYIIADWVELDIQTEVVASGGLDNSFLLCRFSKDQNLDVSNIITGSTGSLIAFPVSIGLTLNW